MSDTAMDKSKILVFGEVLIDLFMSYSSTTERLPMFDCVGLPGGAPCNVAANLVKCGSTVEFASAFGDDLAGKELRKMLLDRGIGLEYSIFPKQSLTPMATVYSENEQNTFRIYMEGSAYSSLEVEDFDWNVLEESHWVHLGSVLMAQENTRELTKVLAQRASKNQCVVSYDINIRPNILSSDKEDNLALVEILRHVDVLKLSNEDFEWIKENLLQDLSDPSDLLAYGCSIIAWTHGAEGAIIITAEEQIKVPPVISVFKDSTGAGDAFTAGIIQFLSSNGIRTKMDIQDIAGNRELLKQAGLFAAGLASEIIAQQGALPRLA